MAIASINLHGIFSPIPTPFSRSGAVDEESLIKHIQSLNSHALSGLVVLGSNGEAVHLSRKERVQVSL